MTTGKQLRSLRTKKQVSQKLLAQCGSWSSAYVHKLEQSRSVSVSQVTRYAAALDAASARVTESRAKEERDSQAVLCRFEVPAPTSKPAARSVQPPPTPPVVPGAVPSATVPARRPPVPTKSPLGSAAPAAPPRFTLNSKPAPLAEPYSPAYTRAYTRMWARFKGRVTVVGAGGASYS